MVGKIKRARQKLHQEAVKISNINNNNVNTMEAGVEKASTLLLNIPKTQSKQTYVKEKDVKVFDFPKRIFAGTIIPQEALVQTLKDSEPSVVQQTAGKQVKDHSQKTLLSKKEKMKERRQKWLNKISAIKIARQQQVDLARRKATPVIGDMRSLVDALPELHPYIKASVCKKQKGLLKKAEPTDYCQMKPGQKRKLLETEVFHFGEVMKDSAFKANPLAAIGEHLRKRFKQEDEQS